MGNREAGRAETPFVDWFPLSDGVLALAVWTPGAAEGAIYADPAWQRAAEQARRIEEWRAEDVVGAENVTWHWHSTSEIEALSRQVLVPSIEGD